MWLCLQLCGRTHWVGLSTLLQAALGWGWGEVLGLGREQDGEGAMVEESPWAWVLCREHMAVSSGGEERGRGLGCGLQAWRLEEVV